MSLRLSSRASRLLPQPWSSIQYSRRLVCRTPQPPCAATGAALWPSNARYLSNSSSFKHDSSVSASEVSHFSNLASSWWDPHGPSRLLHLMNPLRHDFIKSCLRSSPETLNPATKYTYLDIGCGGGIFASSAARLPNTVSVTAIDPTPDVIKVAKEHQRSDPLLSQAGRLNYINCAIEELDAGKDAQAEQGYDFVTLFEVIEHIDKPAEFLRQALTHLKPGGWLIGSTIARHPLSYLTTKVIAEAPWPIGVVPAGTHDWDKYINPTELRQFFVKANSETTTEVTDSLHGKQQEDLGDTFGKVHIDGCIYLPLVGWKWVNGSEGYGNYFFGVQKLR